MIKNLPTQIKDEIKKSNNSKKSLYYLNNPSNLKKYKFYFLLEKKYKQYIKKGSITSYKRDESNKQKHNLIEY